jgi:hypothetical protein
VGLSQVRVIDLEVKVGDVEEGSIKREQGSKCACGRRTS